MRMKKEGWPEFPFNDWDSVEKWDLTSLRLIADHLTQRTYMRRQLSGYSGVPAPMEKQIIDHVSALEQQAGALEDVVQALLQLIDDNGSVNIYV